MPRPRLPDDARLEQTITVRLAAGDLDRLEGVGERLGLKPMTIARRVLLLGLARLEREGLLALEDPSVRKASAGITRTRKRRRTS